MPVAIEKSLPPNSSGRVAIIGSKDRERLKTAIRDLLRDSFRVPNARWEACWRQLRDDARARIGGAGSGVWRREDLEAVIKNHEGYIASSPELTSYVFPNNWKELHQAVRERHAALIIGQSGTGKTLASQKLYDELRKEIPGLERVPITRGPAELNADRTPPPVFYDIEDPWGRFDFEPNSRPWNDQLSQKFSKANHDRILVATTRLDVGQRSGALNTVEQWMVSLESENYGAAERAQLYSSRIGILPRELQVAATKAESMVLKELSTPLEIQKFFDALPTLDRGGLRNPEHFVRDAITRAHQNSIEQTVVDQIEQRKGGVRAAAVIWGLLKATNKLSLPMLRQIEEALADHEPQMIAEASSLVGFFVASRNLRQTEDLITYYHPRVESGIERALIRSELEVKRTLRLLVDVLTSPDGPGEEWGARAAARLIAAVRESGKVEVNPRTVAAAKVDAWLAAHIEEPGGNFEASLKLAAAAGSSALPHAELARYLLHDAEPSWGISHWDRPAKPDAWYETLRNSPAVRPLIQRFVREILPTAHMYYRVAFAKDIKRLAPDLSDAFLEAANRTVSWGCISSDDAIAEGALDDLDGFEKTVDAAVEVLTNSEEDRAKQEELHLALVNGEYSDHYAEHLADNDDGYLPSLRHRLLGRASSQKVLIAAVACAVSHAPSLLHKIATQPESPHSQQQMLEIAAATAHLRDRRAPSGDKLQDATADVDDQAEEEAQLVGIVGCGSLRDDVVEGGNPCLALFLSPGLFGFVLLLLPLKLGLAFLLLPLLLGLIFRHALLVYSFALDGFFVRFRFGCVGHDGRRLGWLRRVSLRVVRMDRAIFVQAYGDSAANVFAKDDDGCLGRWARRLRIGIVRFRNFAVLVPVQCAGALFFGCAPRGLDLNQFGPCGDLTVDVRRDLGLEACAVKALVTLHVRKKARVVPAAA